MTEPTPAPAPAPTPQPAPSPAPEPTPTWYSTFDAETQGHLQNRGWDKLTPDKAAAEAVKAHRNAEHKLGIPSDRVLRLPEKLEGDEMNSIYDRLGRPAKAEEYKFTIPDGMTADPAFQTWAQGTFHKAGLSASQAAAVVDAWHAHMGEMTAEQKKAHDIEFTSQMGDLKKEWGAAYEQNDAIAGRGAEAMGFSKEEVQGIQAIVGAKRTMEFLHKIGAGTMEDGFVSSGNGGGLNGRVLTPAQAAAKIADLRNDADFRKRLMSGDVKAKAEWDNVNAQAVAS